MDRQTTTPYLSLIAGYSPATEAQNPDEIEPRVLTADVAMLVRKVTRPDDDDIGASVSLIAEKADTSTRTVYRILAEDKETISLDLADRLCIAAGAHLAACRLFWPGGTVTPYLDAEFGKIMAS